jgi:hypothetical protein
VIAVLLWACATPQPADSPKVWARVIETEQDLFGGIAAEGRLGDLLLANDRVRFVVQGMREGDYKLVSGGGIVDSDLVRGPAVPGRDLVVEWQGALGGGRILEAETIDVIDDGSSGQAVIRITGRDALTPVDRSQSPDEPDLGVAFVTDYLLEPGCWLVQVTTTLTATSGTARVCPGDLLQVSPAAAVPDDNGWGSDPYAQASWAGFRGMRNEATVALLAETAGHLQRSTTREGASDRTATVEACRGELTLETGEEMSWTRFYGIGPDAGHLTSEWLLRTGLETREVSGEVLSQEGPVAGALVTVGSGVTNAITDAEGRFSVLIEPTQDPSWSVDARGPAVFFELPRGAASRSATGHASLNDYAALTLAEGAPVAALARGYGTGEAGEILNTPARLLLASSEDQPFAARLVSLDEPDADPILAFSRGGTVEVRLPGGAWDLVMHRGVRHEAYQTRLDLAPGERRRVVASMPRAYETPGWLTGDPHQHASPSNDGLISMEHRLIVAAAVGLDLHFGTDHDILVDYNPLLGPLGLDDDLVSIVGDEVTPWDQGHMAVYPVQPIEHAPNGGAWRWWVDPQGSLQEVLDQVLGQHPDALVQANHPGRNGIAKVAGWAPGSIQYPSAWTEEFQAVEVFSGLLETEDLAFYLDLIARGILVTPVGVSDSHSFDDGKFGLDLTFWEMSDGLVQATLARHTVASRGPFLSLSVMPGTELVGGTTLTVSALSPSWIQVDDLVLFKDGVAVDRIFSSSGEFELFPEADASFVVLARGSTPMAPVWPDATPLAIASAILVDVQGDGWTPPLPPITLAE